MVDKTNYNTSGNQLLPIDNSLLEVLPPTVHDIKWLLLNSFISLICIIVYIAILDSSSSVNYDKVFFLEGDPTLSFPYSGDTVSVELLAGLSIGIPLFFILLTVSVYSPQYYYRSNSYQTKLIVIVIMVVGLVQSALLTSAFTDSIKYLVLRPRPNFFAYCNYKGYNDALISNDFKSYNESIVINRIGDIDDCLDKNALPDSILSFPSGHSSTAWSGMTYSMMVLSYMLKDFNENFNFMTLPGVISISPLFLSAWISISRIQDYKHHEDDAMMGGFIGFCVAFYVWKATQQILDKYKNTVDSNKITHRV